MDTNLISRTLANDILSAALSTGSVFAEIFVEYTQKNSIGLVNGAVDRAITGIDYGLGLRVFDGFGAVYTYTNNLSRDNLLKIAKEAALAVKNKGSVNQVLDFTSGQYDKITWADMMPGSLPKSDIIHLFKQSSEISFGYDKLITQTNGSYYDIVQNVLIANSEGLWAEDSRVLESIVVSSIASGGGEKQTGHFRKGARTGVEYLNKLDFKELGKQSAEKAVIMLKADLCPSGMMPVVIGNGFGGVIFHEACGHSLEATAIAKDASVFCGKVGQVIANEKVTAVDDGTMKGEWGSINFDDEGNKSQRNVLIENGVLKSYLVDKLNGIKMDMPSTGSSRRESYKYAPTSRMTNTYIANGNDNMEHMIASIDYGLYAKQMGGGSVTPVTGDFNFAVTEAYMIEKGKITKPVRGATLIGKGADVLMDIDMVGSDMSMEAGLCGSISGSVPTNVGQPMIRVKKMTVGGRL